jgi:predicted regulator of Ras-like GTPase activity (Roadblock/LC7/MglB family)
MLVVNKNFIRVKKKHHQLLIIELNFFCIVKHVLNPLGLAKYEIRQNNQVIADVR